MTQLQVFQCPACGANLSFDGGSQVTMVCEYCQASIMVPQELRPSAASVPAQEPVNTEPYAPVAPLGGAVLTGLALNIAVVNWLVAQASVQTGMKIDKDAMASARIAQAADKAMRTLKTQDTAAISLPFLTADSNGPKNFQIQLTRAIVNQVASGVSNWPGQPPAKAKNIFGF